MLSAINPFAKACVQGGMKSKEAIDIQVGSQSLLVDGWRNLVSIPAKLILWNSKFNSGNVSEETLSQVRDYLHVNGLHDVSVSVNQYKPQEVWSRIFTNPKTSFLSKCTLGVATGLIETIFVPRLTGFGDHYNLSANTVHLFSNDPAIALYACGYAKDYNEKENPSLYALLNGISVIGPVSMVWQSLQGAKNAMKYVKQQSDVEAVRHAWTVLTPLVASSVAIASIGELTNQSIQKIFLDWRMCERPIDNYFNDTLIRLGNEYFDYHCLKRAVNRFTDDLQTYALGAVGIMLIGHLVGRWMASKETRPKDVQTRQCPVHG